MKNILIITTLLLTSQIVFGQTEFIFKVDSLHSEITDFNQVPEKEMLIEVKGGELFLSGYDMFMEEGKTTTFKLAQELGEGEQQADYTLYSSWLYYNNPSPDCNLIIYEYKDNNVMLVIETAAFITKYYCTKKE
ncbi:MAG: hypothetical protein ACI9O4_000769 [Chitinophagales bacterium]|jgi:hypothetical protein